MSFCSGVWLGEKHEECLNLLFGDCNGDIYLYMLFAVFFTGLLGVGGDLVCWCGAAFSLGSPFRRFLESSRMGPGSGKLWV